MKLKGGAKKQKKSKKRLGSKVAAGCRPAAVAL